MKKADGQDWREQNNMMVRWMCGVILRSRTELNIRLGIECIMDVVRQSRVRWFGHVERRIVMIGFQ